MTLARSCPREADVLDIVAIEQWPDRADAELRSHADDCPVCSDLVVAASAMVELRDEHAQRALPDASVVWYRAEVRAREDAARQASRPMLAAHGLAVAAVTALSVAWWADGAAWARAWWRGLVGLWPGLPAEVSLQTVADTLSPAWWLIGAAVAAWLVLLPVAFYLARLADTDAGEKSLLPRARE